MSKLPDWLETTIDFMGECEERHIGTPQRDASARMRKELIDESLTAKNPVPKKNPNSKQLPEDLELWRAGTIAETVDGVSDKLYKKLWQVIGEAEKEWKALGKVEGPEPDAYSDVLENVWTKFTQAEQEEIIDLYFKHEAARKERKKNPTLKTTKTSGGTFKLCDLCAKKWATSATKPSNDPCVPHRYGFQGCECEHSCHFDSHNLKDKKLDLSKFMSETRFKDRSFRIDAKAFVGPKKTPTPVSVEKGVLIIKGTPGRWYVDTLLEGVERNGMLYDQIWLDAGAKWGATGMIDILKEAIVALHSFGEDMDKYLHLVKDQVPTPPRREKKAVDYKEVIKRMDAGDRVRISKEAATGVFAHLYSMKPSRGEEAQIWEDEPGFVRIFFKTAPLKASGLLKPVSNPIIFKSGKDYAKALKILRNAPVNKLADQKYAAALLYKNNLTRPAKTIEGMSKDEFEDFIVNNLGIEANNPRRSEGMTPDQFDQEQLYVGTKHELEHTDDPREAQRIAMDHLAEDADYYKKLEKCVEGTPDMEAIETWEDEKEEQSNPSKPAVSELTVVYRKAFDDSYLGRALLRNTGNQKLNAANKAKLDKAWRDIELFSREMINLTLENVIGLQLKEVNGKSGALQFGENVKVSEQQKGAISVNDLKQDILENRYYKLTLTAYFMSLFQRFFYLGKRDADNIFVSLEDGKGWRRLAQAGNREAHVRAINQAMYALLSNAPPTAVAHWLEDNREVVAKIFEKADTKWKKTLTSRLAKANEKRKELSKLKPKELEANEKLPPVSATPPAPAEYKKPAPQTAAPATPAEPREIDPEDIMAAIEGNQGMQERVAEFLAKNKAQSADEGVQADEKPKKKKPKTP